MSKKYLANIIARADLYTGFAGLFKVGSKALRAAVSGAPADLNMLFILLCSFEQKPSRQFLVMAQGLLAEDTDRSLSRRSVGLKDLPCIRTG
jgi:hypothetical protein